MILIDNLNGGRLAAYLVTERYSLALRVYPYTSLSEKGPFCRHLTVGERESEGIVYRRAGFDDSEGFPIIELRKESVTVSVDERVLVLASGIDIDEFRSSLDTAEREILRKGNHYLLEKGNRLLKSGGLTPEIVRSHMETLYEWVKIARRAEVMIPLNESQRQE